MKLSEQQRSYLASIDSKKKRRKQKEEFKMQNLLFGNDIAEMSENPLDIYFDFSWKTKKAKDECKTDFGEFISKVLNTDNVLNAPVLTKEQLRDLTEPKKQYEGVLEKTSENLRNAFAVGNKPYSQEDIEAICQPKKEYTLDDLENAFKASREYDNSLKGGWFKHDSFASYLDTVGKSDDKIEPTKHLETRDNLVKQGSMFGRTNDFNYISRAYLCELSDEYPDGVDFALKIRNLIH